MTGASTADVAIVLVDARHGVLEQTRRHAFIASLLGVKAIASGGQQDGSRRLGRRRVRLRGQGSRRATSKPCRRRCRSSRSRSARCIGDNVVTLSTNSPWYDGPALLEWLETFDDAVRRRGPGPSRRAARHPSAGFRLPRLRRSAVRRRPQRRRPGHRVAQRSQQRRVRHPALRSRRSLSPRPARPSPCRWPTSSTSPAATCLVVGCRAVDRGGRRATCAG